MSCGIGYKTGVRAVPGRSNARLRTALEKYGDAVKFLACCARGRRALRCSPSNGLGSIATAGVVLGGGVWAALPYLSYKLPAVADNWTSEYFCQILRERYPDHVLNPAWFSYGIRWPLAESLARFGIVLIVLAVVFIYGRFIWYKKPAA